MYRREGGLKDFHCNRQNAALFVDLLKISFLTKVKYHKGYFLYLIFFCKLLKMVNFAYKSVKYNFSNKVSSMGVNLLDH